MNAMPLLFAASCDLARKVRGKAFPADQLETRRVRGVGWTPTNVLITCFGKSAGGFVRLPTSMETALDRFEANSVVTGWFPECFASVYRARKDAGIAHPADMDTGGRRVAYEGAY